MPKKKVVKESTATEAPSEDSEDIVAYEVEIPIAGCAYLTVEVPASSTGNEDAIFDAALDSHPKDVDIEYEFYRALTHGNVLYPSINEWSFRKVQ